MWNIKKKYSVAFFFICACFFISFYSLRRFNWEKFCKDCFHYDSRYYHPELWYYYYNVRNILELNCSPIQSTAYLTYKNNDSILYHIDYLIQYPLSIDIMGWTYIKKKSGFLTTTMITLTGNNETFFFPSRKVYRPDIIQLENDSNLSLAGFTSLINIESIPANYYRLGMILNTGQSIESRSSEYIIDVGSVTENLLQKKSTLEIFHAIDIWNESDEFFEITGWAFIKGYEQLPVTHLVLLYSSQEKHLFATNQIYRPDVSAAYGNEPHDSTGFTMKFPKKKIPSGVYSAAIIITTNQLENELLKLENKLVIGNL